MKMTLPYNLPDKSNSELYNFEIQNYHKNIWLSFYL